MTIIAGFSSSRQGPAPLNLATQLARTTGEKIIAAVVVERAVPAGVDPIEDEYRGYLASRATESLQRLVDRLPGDLDISMTVHHSTSIPNGLMELANQHSADLVVVGSSSSGLLGRVALGSVTDRLVHTSKVSVAIAPLVGFAMLGALTRFPASSELVFSRFAPGEAPFATVTVRTAHCAVFPAAS